MIQLKRVYDEPGSHDGIRFLVQRPWPRGIRKTDLRPGAWLKDADPSSELRKWFSHDPLMSSGQRGCSVGIEDSYLCCNSVLAPLTYHKGRSRG
jgi:hypothetical protein